MKILIIGAKGQLGTDCCSLFGKEHTVLGCDIPALDISKNEEVSGYISTEKPDVIINCAAFTAVDLCEKEIDLCWKVNAEGPKNLAIAAQKNGSRLVHISTDYVFDGSGSHFRREDEKTGPLNVYGETK